MPIPIPVVGLHSHRCHRAHCRQGLACGCSEGVSLAIGGCEGGGTALTRALSCDMGQAVEQGFTRPARVTAAQPRPGL
jgi:hypothetical protein